jgi:hypothetical protein
MPFRLLALVLLGLLALLPRSAFAESTDCLAPVVIIPDGRVTQGSIPASTTFWYGVYAQANHSYSVEFVPAADNFFNSIRPQFNAVVVYSPSDTLQLCRGTSSVAVTPNSGYSPTILKNGNGAGRRVSFIAQSSGLYLIAATNVMGSGTYSFRAVDTTLVSVRWNTLSGYDAQWILLNVSDMPVSGTLLILDMSAQILASVPISLPSGGRTTRSSSVSDINLPRNAAGQALFVHNGPPRAVVGEAFMIGQTTILAEKFEPVTSQ